MNNKYSYKTYKQRIETWVGMLAGTVCLSSLVNILGFIIVLFCCIPTATVCPSILTTRHGCSNMVVNFLFLFVFLLPIL